MSFTEIEKIPSMLEEIQNDMLKTAREQSKENTIDISDYTEFKSKIEKGRFL